MPLERDGLNFQQAVFDSEFYGLVSIRSKYSHPVYGRHMSIHYCFLPFRYVTGVTGVA